MKKFKRIGNLELRQANMLEIVYWHKNPYYQKENDYIKQDKGPQGPLSKFFIALWTSSFDAETPRWLYRCVFIVVIPDGRDEEGRSQSLRG